jgi:hypothetical protein
MVCEICRSDVPSTVGFDLCSKHLKPASVGNHAHELSEKHMKQQTSKQVALFGTQPELLAGLHLVGKKNGADIQVAGAIPAVAGEDKVQVKLVLETRKIVAERLGLGRPNKDNAHLIDAEIDRMKAAGKKMMAGEVARLMADENWTFSAMGVSQAKSGKQRAAFALETKLPPKAFEVTREQLVKALARLSEDEQTAALEEAESLARGATAIDAQAAETVEA